MRLSDLESSVFMRLEEGSSSVQSSRVADILEEMPQLGSGIVGLRSQKQRAIRSIRCLRLPPLTYQSAKLALLAQPGRIAQGNLQVKGKVSL